MAKMVWINANLFLKGKVGEKTFKTKLDELAEFFGGTVDTFNYRDTKIVDRDPLVKVGQRIWVPQNEIYIEEHLKVSVELFPIPATVIQIGRPGMRGYEIEFNISQKLKAKLKWHPKDTSFTNDDRVFLTKPDLTPEV